MSAGREYRREELAGQHSWLRRQGHWLLGRRLRRFLDSTDLAQEVHLEAERKLRGKSFANGKAFRSWLLVILRHVITRAARDRRQTSLHPSAFSRLPSAEQTPSRQFRRRDAGRRLRKQISELPGRDREVVLMRVAQDEPFARIADRLGITEGHARVLFHRALEKLRPGAPDVDQA
jgi:RNA polymerase sigma-70 factor (ECF subfamily)